MERIRSLRLPALISTFPAYSFPNVRRGDLLLLTFIPYFRRMTEGVLPDLRSPVGHKRARQTPPLNTANEHHLNHERVFSTLLSLLYNNGVCVR